MKTMVRFRAVDPARNLPCIERVVSHHDIAHASNFQYSIEVLVRILRTEESARLFEVGRPCVKAKCVKDGNDTASSFRKRGILDKECLPDEVGPFHLSHPPKARVRQISRAEGLGDEIVISQQVINTMEAQSVELRRKDVSVNINHRRRSDQELHLSPEFCPIGEQLSTRNTIFNRYHCSIPFSQHVKS